MISDKKYVTASTHYGIEYTDTIENLVTNNLITMDYPAEPYYLGYIPKNDVPDRLIFSHVEKPQTDDNYITATIEKIPLPFTFSGKYNSNDTPISANAYYRYNTDVAKWQHTSDINYYSNITFINKLPSLFETIGGSIQLEAMIYDPDSNENHYFQIRSDLSGSFYYQNGISFYDLIDSYKNGTLLTLKTLADSTATFQISLKDFNSDGIYENIEYKGKIWNCVFYGIYFSNNRDILSNGYGGYSGIKFSYDYNDQYMGRREVSYRMSTMSFSDYNFSFKILLYDKSNNSLSNASILGGQYIGGFHFTLSRADTQLPTNCHIHRGNCIFSNSTNSTTMPVYIILTPKDIFTICSCMPCMYKSGVAYGRAKRMYPIFEDNHFTGEWADGAKEEDLKKLQSWQLYDINDNDFTKDDIPNDDDDPSATPNDPGKREDKIVGDRIGSGGAARIVPQTGVRYYAMTGQEMLSLRSLVWAQTKDFYSALNIINTEGTDTIFNYISSLRYYPFSDITNFLTVSSIQERVVLGTGATIQNTAVTPYTDFTLRTAEDKNFQTTLCYWNLSDLPWRNNFLDFTPYSKLVVTIPYCGDVELDLNRVAAFSSLSNTVLWLWASGDIDSGTITFSLFTGTPGAAYDQILYSKNIKIAIDLPLSGNDQITQSNAILQATYNQASKVLSVGSSLISSAEKTAGKLASHTANVGDVAKFATDAVQGVMDVGIASAEASLAKRQVPVSTGDINGTIATTQTRQFPYLTLYRQKTANPANYGHTTGFVCEAAYTLSQLSGFTVLSNPDLSMVQGATQEELSELMGILTTGFYI